MKADDKKRHAALAEEIRQHVIGVIVTTTGSIASCLIWRRQTQRLPRWIRLVSAWAASRSVSFPNIGMRCR